MDMNRSRRLNFNAPFLSTKRHVGQEKLSDQFPEASVPFCWETTPGMPKNLSFLKTDEESETPRLKLPPGRLKVHNGENENDDASEGLTPASFLRLKKRDNHEHFHQTNRENVDNTSEGLILASILRLKRDNNEYLTNRETVNNASESLTPSSFLRWKKRDNHKHFQDTVDVLSLTQAIDMVERPEDNLTESEDGSSIGGGDDSNGYLTMESTERSEDMSPSYIIERFLPDAAALAAVTSAANQRKKKKLSYLSATVRQSCFPPKGCGLHVLLPWSTKHRICGVKDAFTPQLQPKFITKDN